QNQKFNHGLLETDYPQVENIRQQIKEQTQKLQQKKQDLCQKTRDFINEYFPETEKET
ncbi:12982_t:CDS:1, partial [Racocetra persica]